MMIARITEVVSSSAFGFLSVGLFSMCSRLMPFVHQSGSHSHQLRDPSHQRGQISQAVTNKPQTHRRTTKLIGRKSLSRLPERFAKDGTVLPDRRRSRLPI